MGFFRSSFRPSCLRFILARNYNGFLVDMDSLVQANLHLAWNYNVFVVDMYSLYVPHICLRACIQRSVFIMLLEYLQNRLRSRTCMQNVRSHVVRETVRSESNRPRVLREQKVLPEVRNRQLLLRDFFSCSTFEELVRIQWGILPFTHSISDILIRPS